MDSPAWFLEAIKQISTDLADSEAPYLGAHAMSEFIYCPRAGIITVDQRKEDTGSDDEQGPTLGGLPTHDLELIQAELARVREELKWPIAWGIGLGLITILGFLALWTSPFRWILLLCSSMPMYVTARIIKERFTTYAVLRARLREAESAAIAEPDWTLRQPQPINWWSLIRAGFVSHELRAPIVDQDLRLAGKPFRVLQRGAVHIPVMHLTVPDAEEDLRRQGRLRPPQRARLAAYSYLLHHVQRSQSDWAIVLFKGTFEGVALPIDQAMLLTFTEGLKSARAYLSEYESNRDYNPAPARERTPCVKCPFAEPISPEKRSEFRGVPVTSFLTQAWNGKHYHSTCGDRFRWVPPHSKAEALELIPR